MLIAQPVLLLRQVLRFAGGVGEQVAASGVVGSVLNRAQHKVVKAVLIEPVRCRKDVMEEAMRRLGDCFRQFVEKLVDEIMAAGDIGDCQYWNGAVWRQRLVNAVISGD